MRRRAECAAVAGVGCRYVVNQAVIAGTGESFAGQPQHVALFFGICQYVVPHLVDLLHFHFFFD